MNTNEPDKTWTNLLAQSAPTFAAEMKPPYGFITNTLAALRSESLHRREIERIGWRALLASLGALVTAVVLTVAINLHEENSDFDPGVRSLVQVDSLSYS